MSRKPNVWFIFTFFLLLWMAAAPVRGQDYRGKVQGLVTDATQAVVVGAKVTLANVNTGISAARETGPNGHYLFDFVEPGMYTLAVEQPGFNKFVQENIQVQVRGDVTVNPVLAVGNVAEQVTVTERVSALQFNTSTMDLTVDRKMLTDLPILARNPFTLALLDPAVVNRYWTDRNPFYMWSSSSIDVGGSTSGKNDLLLDGAPLMMTNKGSYAPPMDAVQEFTVQQNSVDAESGNSAGGVLSLSMKSGTNDFHGTAYYFGRNPKLNALSSHVTRTPNKVRNHIWGGTLGNPIRKNKLFTFTAWEQWRTNTPRENLLTLPTELERSGDFSQSYGVTGAVRTIFDPWTTKFDPASGIATRTPFPGNRIPAERIDPTARRFLQDVWQPNNPGDDVTRVNNFKETFVLSTKYWNLSNRTDWNISDKWRVFGRYSQFRNTIGEGHTVESPAIPRWDGGAMYALNLAGDTVYMLSPRMVLNLSGSYGSIHDDYDDPTGKLTDADLASFWPNKWFAPYTKDLSVRYYPNAVVGDATFGHGFWWIEHPKNGSFHAKLGQNLGRHDVKYGFSYRRWFGYVNYPSPMTFNFGPALTADTFVQPNTALRGSSYATFLLGALGSDSQAQYISPHRPSVNGYAGYVQDDFKLTPRITLNLGLRYEYSTGMKDANDVISRYLDLGNPIPEMQANPPTIPAEVTAIAGIPYRWNGAWMFADSDNRSTFQTNKLGFMPRAGLAVRLDDRTALRAGYARFVTPVVMTQPFLTTGLPIYGFTARSSVAPVIEGIPGGRLSDPFPATNPLVLPTGRSLGRYQNLGDSASWNVQDFKTSVSDRLNISLQRQLPYHFAVDATYFLNLGHNLAYTRQMNLMDPQLSYTHKGALDKSVPNPFYQYLTPDKFPGQLRYQKTVTVGSLLKQYPQYGTLGQMLTPRMLNRYHALQLRVQRPFANGFGILWTYNYNRERQSNFFNAIDQYADRFTFLDSNNPRHRMNIAGTYDLPFGKGRPWMSDANAVVNAILGGWSTSWIFSYNSGAFLRFGQLTVTGDPRISNPTRSRYFDTSVFKPAEPYTPRTNPYQYAGVTGPRFGNLDATLSKFFPLRGESLRLEFKMEAYNLSNSFMASNPSMDVYSSLFGRSTGQANRGREMQYSMRLHF
ncbi:MAG: TonB-dependent receptor [Bryobacterales bacterium]|nr:TonB-dependent receptor [Bryobacterales bacterium]